MLPAVLLEAATKTCTVVCSQAVARALDWRTAGERNRETTTACRGQSRPRVRQRKTLDLAAIRAGESTMRGQESSLLALSILGLQTGSPEPKCPSHNFHSILVVSTPLWRAWLMSRTGQVCVQLSNMRTRVFSTKLLNYFPTVRERADFVSPFMGEDTPCLLSRMRFELTSSPA